MSDKHEAEAGRTRLASALIANGSLTSDWLASYNAVPRHWFVPDTTWPGQADGVRQGEAVSRQADPAAWWSAVYSDVPLTTQWDDGTHTGDSRGTMPTSSNSMPTMVFSMLDALDVAEDNRVLEIGTGTGWNAALLAHRVGPGNVVTVEVDEGSATDAQGRLARAGYSPTLVVADGAEGYAKAAPYDRVIATCSVGRVPYAWVEQSRPGGVIVAPWGPEYGGEAVARLTVGDDGTATGRFIGSSAFMRLRQQRTPRPDSLTYLSAPWPAGGARFRSSLSPDDVGGWLEMFSIGVQVPGAFPLTERYPDGTYTLWLHDTAVTSWATADWEPDRTDYEVVQSGPRNLWDEVEAAWRWWDDQGRPGFDRFGLTVTADSHAVWLDSPDNPVPRRS
ncbi:methyltransferase domain-containing protein [Kitasatospora aureofaciens]|uniref:Protein-L-isoaspartate O-methyltransferase n=1 Tax=Kitasatospora aureofaciens TaxID=1894 RepID=A0A8H9HLX7_KITAU|nr:methyltransferase domain-containing protein [Kitasatospora aureofaciens]UKZ06799.1 methyltransferase domain-containing protein [Streptomyces viridifaciens]GGU67055.1 protein-L-isoaspartate O-methyltransferase [Kitasatospora aureofaciens]